MKNNRKAIAWISTILMVTTVSCNSDEIKIETTEKGNQEIIISNEEIQKEMEKTLEDLEKEMEKLQDLDNIKPDKPIEPFNPDKDDDKYTPPPSEAYNPLPQDYKPQNMPAMPTEPPEFTEGGKNPFSAPEFTEEK